jgi:ABC-type lipoprotein release transport system permease subunit
MRRIRVIISIAFAQLFGRRRQTLLVTAGVAIGVTVMIVTFGLTDGIISSIQEKIVNISPLITLTGERIPVFVLLCIQGQSLVGPRNH